jgi:hypothetical protein
MQGTRFEHQFNGKKLMLSPVEVKLNLSYSEIPLEAKKSNIVETV